MSVTVQQVLNFLSPYILEKKCVYEKEVIKTPSAIENLKNNSIVYVKNMTNFKTIDWGKVTLLITDSESFESLKNAEIFNLLETHKVSFVSVNNLQLVMAKVNSQFFLPLQNRSCFDDALVDSKAVIHSSVIIGKNTIIHPGVVIAKDVIVGDNVFIGANTVIEEGVKIGNNVHIHPLVQVGYGTEIKDNVVIKSHSTIASDGFGFAQDEKGNHYRKPHYGKVILNENVHIGANVTIDRGTYNDTIFEEGCIVDNLCHFGHNFKLGKNTIVTGGFMGAGSATIGKYCVIGGRTTVGGHLSVADKTQLAALSAVSKTVSKPGAYGGYPLQPLQLFLKSNATIAQLPNMRKKITELSRKLLDLNKRV